MSPWIGASKDKAEAESIANKAKEQGIETDIFLTTDLSNLNKEPYYVLTAGVYDSKEDVDKNLASVKKVFFHKIIILFCNYLM